MSLEDAVVDAGAVRFRPMLLTAAAVVVGASVILFDPIFQGLALSGDGGRGGVHRLVADGGASPLLSLPEGTFDSTGTSAFARKCGRMRNTAIRNCVGRDYVQGELSMTVERTLRLIAGSFI